MLPRLRPSAFSHSSQLPKLENSSKIWRDADRRTDKRFEQTAQRRIRAMTVERPPEQEQIIGKILGN